MTDFKKLFVAIKESKWKYKIQLTEYLLNILKQIKNPDEGDRKEILGFAREQILMLLEEIPNKTEYKEKDLCCAYGDRILAIYPMTDPSRKTVTEEELSVLKKEHP